MDCVPVRMVNWVNTGPVTFRSAKLEIPQELQVFITTGLVKLTGTLFEHGHRKLHMIPNLIRYREKVNEEIFQSVIRIGNLR